MRCRSPVEQRRGEDGMNEHRKMIQSSTAGVSDHGHGFSAFGSACGLQFCRSAREAVRHCLCRIADGLPSGFFHGHGLASPPGRIGGRLDPARQRVRKLMPLARHSNATQSLLVEEGSKNAFCDCGLTTGVPPRHCSDETSPTSALRLSFPIRKRSLGPTLGATATSPHKVTAKYRSHRITTKSCLDRRA